MMTNVRIEVPLIITSRRVLAARRLLATELVPVRGGDYSAPSYDFARTVAMNPLTHPGFSANKTRRYRIPCRNGGSV